MSYIIKISDSTIRKTVTERFKDQLRCVKLIHLSVIFGLAQKEVIGNYTGATIAIGVQFASGLLTGDFCISNQNVTVSHNGMMESDVHEVIDANVLGNVHLQDRHWVCVGAAFNQSSPTKKLEVGVNTVVDAVMVADYNRNAIHVCGCYCEDD